MVFACYIYNGTLEEEFLFCRPLTTTTRGQDILNILSEFFTEKTLIGKIWLQFALMGRQPCSAVDLVL